MPALRPTFAALLCIFSVVPRLFFSPSLALLAASALEVRTESFTGSPTNYFDARSVQFRAPGPQAVSDKDGLYDRRADADSMQVLVSSPGFKQEKQAKHREEARTQDLPDLYEAGIDELQRGLRSGDYTSADLVNAYLARIAEVNLQGPMLRAVIETNEYAIAAAHALDAERDLSPGRKGRGSLHGIPIIVKDNIATAAWEGSIVPSDATVIAKLRKAGAIILGKANLSEWAHYRGNLTSGWSGRGGQCTNPYYPGADPCGSSSGSGVSSAIGLATVALGTETDGSIICPSQYNNLVGIKPSVGLTSRAGVIPISANQDTVGPMARSVADAAHVLSVIAGRDPKGDNYTLAQPVQVPDYTKALNKDALKGKRIGVPRRGFLNATLAGFNPSVIVKFNESLETLKQLGATVVDPADFPDADELIASNNETIVLDIDFKLNLNSYLSKLVKVPTGVRTLADLIKYDNDHPQLELPANYSDQSIFIESEATNGYNSTYYAALANDHSLGRDRGIDGALKKYGLDALVLPSGGDTTVPAAIAGYPIITVPLGFYPANVTIQSSDPNTVYPAPGVPFGLAFLGTQFSEYDLIGYAYAYEQKTHTRLERRAYAAAIPKTQLKDVMN